MCLWSPTDADKRRGSSTFTRCGKLVPLAPPHTADIPGLSMSAGLSRTALPVSRVSALALSLLVADVIPRFPEISRRLYCSPWAHMCDTRCSTSRFLKNVRVGSDGTIHKISYLHRHNFPPNPPWDNAKRHHGWLRQSLSPVFRIANSGQHEHAVE